MRIRVCPVCGVSHKRTSPLCQRCYNYSKRHPEGRYPLPEKYKLLCAPNGDIVCHVCGEAHRKLIQHAYQVHHLSHNEYCDKFGFLHNTKFTTEPYQQMMRDYTVKYKEIVIDKNLLVGGRSTRFHAGQEVVGRGRHIMKGDDSSDES